MSQRLDVTTTKLGRMCLAAGVGFARVGTHRHLDEVRD